MKMVFLFFLLIVTIQSNSYASFGSLQVSPTRIYIASDTSSSRVLLKNVGNQTKTYRINLIYYKMNTNGSLTEEATPPNDSAHSLVKFSPKRVTLPPYSEQLVRILVKRPTELAQGEYRTHIVFKEVETYKEAQERQMAAAAGNLTMQLTPRLGIGVPIIVATGDTSAEIAMSDLQLSFKDSNITGYKVKIHKRGNASVYGDILCYYIAPSGEKMLVKESLGVSSYIPELELTHQLSNPTPFENGKFRIEYRQDSKHNRKLITYTEVNLDENSTANHSD